MKGERWYGDGNGYVITHLVRVSTSPVYDGSVSNRWIQIYVDARTVIVTGGEQRGRIEKMESRGCGN